MEELARVGRPVRVVSISFQGRDLDEIAEVVDREGARGADLVALPETWRGQGDSPETLEGPTIAAMAALARKHGTYIVCPIDRMAGRVRLNSAVLLDRSGAIVCVYDKLYPYWSEFDLQPAVEPGTEACVYRADFGSVGMAICFDVNFPDVWASLADKGAELVVWPSAYSAGSALHAHALMHHFYIVTATQTCDCIACDINGEQIGYWKGEGIQVSRITLDLDRGIYHENFNMEKRARLLAERGDDVMLEQHLEREQWFVLKACRPGVSARDLARRYGLEELRDYVRRSAHAIAPRRAVVGASAAL